jgi:hypothetical protein
MLRLLAMFAFAFAAVFEAWKISHGSFNWMLLMLLGLLFWCISSAWDRTPW